jgi:hypothetical protein
MIHAGKEVFKAMNVGLANKTVCAS